MIEEKIHYRLDRNLTINSFKKSIPKARTLTSVKKTSSGNESYKDMRIPFGKHRNELIADIPNGYLKWLLEQEFFETKFHEHWIITKKELEYRKNFDIYINE